MSLFIELLLIMALKAISIFSIIYTGINSHGGHPGWMIVCNKKETFKKKQCALYFALELRDDDFSCNKAGISSTLVTPDIMRLIAFCNIIYDSYWFF